MSRPTISIVRSLPPSARTWSGSRKNEVKVRQKQRFAAVTRAKRGESRGSGGDARARSGMGRGGLLARRAAHYCSSPQTRGNAHRVTDGCARLAQLWPRSTSGNAH